MPGVSTLDRRWGSTLVLGDPGPTVPRSDDTMKVAPRTLVVPRDHLYGIALEAIHSFFRALSPRKLNKSSRRLLTLYLFHICPRTALVCDTTAICVSVWVRGNPHAVPYAFLQFQHDPRPRPIALLSWAQELFSIKIPATSSLILAVVLYLLAHQAQAGSGNLRLDI